MPVCTEEKRNEIRELLKNSILELNNHNFKKSKEFVGRVYTELTDLY